MATFILIGFLCVGLFCMIMLFLRNRQLEEKLFFEEQARKYDHEAYEKQHKELLIRLIAAHLRFYHAQRERDDAHKNLEMVIEHKDPVPIGIPTKKRKKT